MWIETGEGILVNTDHLIEGKEEGSGKYLMKTIIGGIVQFHKIVWYKGTKFNFADVVNGFADKKIEAATVAAAKEKEK